MDELIKVFTDYPANRTIFTVWDGVLNIILPTVFTFVLALVYRKTHKGVSYNPAFLKTLFILSITTAILMMIIGSNVARAFSLVGALSIVRFRTAVKDPMDIGFIFLAIALGMSCGTGFYVIGGTLCIGATLLLFALDKFSFGSGITQTVILNCSYTVDKSVNELKDSLGKHINNVLIISSESKSGEGHLERTLMGNPNKNFNESELMKTLKADIDPNLKLTIVYQTDASPI